MKPHIADEKAETLENSEFLEVLIASSLQSRLFNQHVLKTPQRWVPLNVLAFGNT